MVCEEAQDLIAGYLDHEVDVSTRARIDEHLDQCTSCKLLFDDVSAVPMTLPDPPRQADEFWRPMDLRIDRALEHNTTPPSALWRTAGYAAALVLALVWGAHNHYRAERAERAAAELAQQLLLREGGSPMTASARLPSKWSLSPNARAASASTGAPRYSLDPTWSMAGMPRTSGADALGTATLVSETWTTPEASQE